MQRALLFGQFLPVLFLGEGACLRTLWLVLSSSRSAQAPRRGGRRSIGQYLPLQNGQRTTQFRRRDNSVDNSNVLVVPSMRMTVKPDP
jgi:hypothetical protein